jgi:aryl-alcohol dehydrogenase-like predicted oxidoreductase
MDTRRIGSLEVSVVGLGCNNFGSRIDEAQTKVVVDAAIDAGVTFFDTADIYGGTLSEEYLGWILGPRRDRIVLATKFGMRVDDAHPGGADAAYIRSEVEESLRRLRTDRIDLYQLHTPDDDTPIAETLATLDELVQAGKVREIGCSNLTASQLREAEVAAADTAAHFVSVQNELNLLDRADETDGLVGAAELGIAYIPFAPLASGLLTGKFRRGEPPPPGTRIANWGERGREILNDTTFDRVEALTSFAKERGHTLLELSFAWLLAQEPVTSVIAGATSPEQVAANASAGTWRLEPEDLVELARL